MRKPRTAFSPSASRASQTTPTLAAEYSVRPSVGLLVLFPSYFWHGTVPFRSHQARLSVAFDAVPDR